MLVHLNPSFPVYQTSSHMNCVQVIEHAQVSQGFEAQFFYLALCTSQAYADHQHSLCI